jgi:hypothetical protein
MLALLGAHFILHVGRIRVKVVFVAFLQKTRKCIASECGTEDENLAFRVTAYKARVFIAVLCSDRHSTELRL